MNYVVDAIILIACYFVGAIPTGLLVGQKLAGIDVREHGSKNIGTTNVWRVLGWKLGLTTFLIDVVKSFLIVYFSKHLAAYANAKFGAQDQGIPYLPIFAGAAVLIGNMFNVFLGWKGGKGIATSMGVFLALCPISILISFGVFLLLLKTTGYVSIGSIVAAAILPFTTWYFYGFGPLPVIIFIMAVIVIWKHRANIRRLMDGTELKAGKKTEA
ncbi:glycerol-3-phosphate 1-O-acyltransferase PlsY [soil metagenome]